MNHPYRLAGLADLVGLLLDGWQVTGLQYTDRCSFDGADDGPAGLVALRRGEERDYVFLVDDGRALSHRAVLQQFREHPLIWKRARAGIEDLIVIPEAPPQAANEWADIPEPFPEALELSPGNLTGVIPVQQVQCVGEVSIALTALETFVHGARVHVVCHAPHAAAWAEMGFSELQASDEGGRLYRVACTEVTQRGTRFTSSLVIAPAVPQNAHRFTITIGRFGRLDGDDSSTVRGPWVFRLPIE